MGGIHRFFTNTATVTPYLGASGYGADLYGPPVQVVGFWDGGNTLTRDKTGQQVLAAGVFYTTRDMEPQFPLDALVTVVATTGRVVGVDVRDSAGNGLPDHIAVTLI